MHENIMVRLNTHSLEGREVVVHLEPLAHIMHVVPRALGNYSDEYTSH